MLRGWAGRVCSLRGSFERIVGDTFVISSVAYSCPSTDTVAGRVDGAIFAYDLNVGRGRSARGKRISASVARRGGR